ELGADVVRLEPAGGSAERRQGLRTRGVSLDFASVNLGKRATGLDRLESLAAGADILIEPGTIDVAAGRSANPAPVVMSVTDFGMVGRFAKWTGSGPVFHALSSALSRSGLPDREPLLPPGDLAHTCAAVQAVFAVLLAFWNR